MKNTYNKKFWKLLVLNRLHVLLGLFLLNATAIAQSDIEVSLGFTTAQVAQGQNIFLQECADSCHQNNLSGAGPVPALLGPSFASIWNNRPVKELIDTIKNSMPPNDVGNLALTSYTSIAAYLLYMNGAEANSLTLGANDTGLVSEFTSLGQPRDVMAQQPPHDPEILSGLTLSGVVPNFRPVTNEMLQNPDPKDWLMLRGNLNAWNYSELKEVTTENVKDLQLAWVWSLGDEANSQQAPVVHDGILYMFVPGNKVQALDAETGELIWEYALGGQLGTMRGISIAEDKIITNTPDGKIFALRADNGALLWESSVGDYSLTSGPLVVDGMVFTGVGGCLRFRTDKCKVAAYDLEDGHEVWKFSTIEESTPGNGTWGNIDPLFRAGNDAWITPSYDAINKLLFIGVSQPKPWMPVSRGMTTSDDALYSNSTLALEAETGKLRWYYQHVAAEVFDLDEVFERVLIDLDGEPLVFSVGKHGILWKLNRLSGAYLGHKETILQTAFDYFDPITGHPRYRADIIESGLDEWLEVCPSSAGGKNWHAMSYHPQHESLVIPLSQSCLRQKANSVDFIEGGGGAGVNRDWYPMPGKEGKMGKLAAFDANTLKELWSLEQPASFMTAVLSTAGDLVFVGDMDRVFKAVDVRTGEILWSTRLGTSVQGFPITFSVNGRQYIAVSTGLGGGSPRLVPSRLTPEINYPQSGSALYVFALPAKH